MRMNTIELRELFKDINDREKADNIFNFCREHMIDAFELRALHLIYDRKIEDLELKDSIIHMSDRELLENIYIILKERDDK